MYIYTSANIDIYIYVQDTSISPSIHACTIPAIHPQIHPSFHPDMHECMYSSTPSTQPSTNPPIQPFHPSKQQDVLTYLHDRSASLSVIRRGSRRRVWLDVSFETFYTCQCICLGLCFADVRLLTHSHSVPPSLTPSRHTHSPAATLQVRWGT